jgi:hypothetical protein
MAKKQTYASVMKDLSKKKSTYEQGLEEAERVGNPQGVQDYKRRLQKLNAGIDELFATQEKGKMMHGGMTKKYANGGETVRTVPADGNYPNAYVSPSGEYIIVTDPTTGQELVMTEQMNNNLQDGVFGSNLSNGVYSNQAPVYTQMDNDPNAVSYDTPAAPPALPSQEMMQQLNPELYDAVSRAQGTGDYAPATEQPITTSPAGPMSARQMQHEFGKNFTDAGAPNLGMVNLIPSAAVGSSPAAPTTPPAPRNYAGEQPTGPALERLSPIQQNTFLQDPAARSMELMGGTPPTIPGAGQEPGLRSRMQDAGMGIAGAAQNFGGKAKEFIGNNKQGIGMALGAAAQFLPDISAMRAMDRLEGPVDAAQMQFRAQNTDLMTGRALNAIDQEAARANASVEANVANPVVAAAMRRASQRIAGGQKANILTNEAQQELGLKNQNLARATQNFNQNAQINAQNQQRAIDFANEKLAAKNRMKQQMGMKLGGVFQDFQNRSLDMQKYDIMSKQIDQGYLDRNGLNIEDLFS